MLIIGDSAVHRGTPILQGPFQAFLEDRSGATAIEYSIIAAGVALAVISLVYGLGSKLVTTFISVQNGFK